MRPIRPNLEVPTRVTLRAHPLASAGMWPFGGGDPRFAQPLQGGIGVDQLFTLKVAAVLASHSGQFSEGLIHKLHPNILNRSWTTATIDSHLRTFLRDDTLRVADGLAEAEPLVDRRL